MVEPNRNLLLDRLEQSLAEQNRVLAEAQAALAEREARTDRRD